MTPAKTEKGTQGGGIVPHEAANELVLASALSAQMVAPFLPPAYQSTLAFVVGSASLLYQQASIKKVIQCIDEIRREERPCSLSDEDLQQIAVLTLKAIGSEFDEEKLRCFVDAFENFATKGDSEHLDDFKFALSQLESLSVTEFQVLMLMKSAPNVYVGSLHIGTYNVAGKTGPTLGKVLSDRLQVSGIKLRLMLKKLRSLGLLSDASNPHEIASFDGLDYVMKTLSIAEPTWPNDRYDRMRSIKEHIGDAILYLYEFPQIDMSGITKITLGAVRSHYEKNKMPGDFDRLLGHLLRDYDSDLKDKSLEDIRLLIESEVDNDEDLSTYVHAGSKYVITYRDSNDFMRQGLPQNM